MNADKPASRLVHEKTDFSFAEVVSHELNYIDARRHGGESKTTGATDASELSLDDFEAKALKRARRRSFATARAKIAHLLQGTSEKGNAASPMSANVHDRIDLILKEADSKAINEAGEHRKLEAENRAKRAATIVTHEQQLRHDFVAGMSAAVQKRVPAGDRAAARDTTEHEATRRVLDVARGKDLVGLALSGGGIRSATFNLGLLQGLADLGLLKRIDYLSTVSGGGYIGSWLAAWAHREKSILGVEKQMRSSRVKQAKGRPAPSPVVQEEPDPVLHLRSYSNYLAPRPSLGSWDTWVLIAIYLRNLLLNQFMLIPSVLALLLIPRLLLLFYHWDGSGSGDSFQYLLLVMVGAFFILAAVIISHGLKRVRPQSSFGRAVSPLDWRYLVIGAVLPLTLASVVVSWFAWDRYIGERGRNILPHLIEQTATSASIYWRAALVFGLLALAIFVVFSLIVFGLAVTNFVRGSLIHGVRTTLRRTYRFACNYHVLGRMAFTLIATLIGGALLGLVFEIAYQHWNARVSTSTAAVSAVPIDIHVQQLALVLTFGPAVVMLTYYFATVIWVGLMGNFLSDPEREWWASLCARILQAVAALVVFFGLALFGVPLVILATPLGVKLLGTGWVAATASGVIAGGSSATGKGTRGTVLDIIARAAPYVFLIGLIILLSWVLHLMIDDSPTPESFTNEVTVTEFPAHIETHSVDLAPASLSSTRAYDATIDQESQQIRSYWTGVFGAPTTGEPDRATLVVKWLAWLCAFAAVALVASWCVGVNTFSLQQMYSYRLVRCYLGASRRKDPQMVPQGAPTNVTSTDLRRPDPITGFDPKDDLHLHSLATNPSGPYLLVNTAMNLVQDADLAWQERKATAFTLAPCFAGSPLTRYRPLPEYGSGRWVVKPITLGEAVAISGAAASPNMGYHSSPAVTALLTVFNLRLGAWMANPSVESSWRLREPSMALFHLISELLGLTNRRSRYVYLSDGGHYENLGVYELIRRHCRFIVASDAGADPKFDFFDLGGLIRKCRIDLGVPIEIDVTPIKPEANGNSKWHCAIGLIRYDYVDPRAIPGILVYIKNSLTGNEPSDVLNFAHQNPPFPHQPTTNQFFSESQFESYRALGHHVAIEVFARAMRDVEWTDQMDDATHRRVVEPFFSNLHRQWFPPPPKIEENYLESVKSCVDVVAALREDPQLQEFSRSLFPELERTTGVTMPAPAPVPGAPPQAHDRAELHMVEQLVEAMESAWLGTHLDGSQAHPLNRGWMNAFRRWASSAIVRKHWPTVRGEYSQDFVRFCEDELKLDRGEIHVYPLDLCLGFEGSAAWLRMQKEFSEEWPGEPPLELTLRSVAMVQESDLNIRAAWLISVAAFDDPWPARWSHDQFPYGICTLFDDPAVPHRELFIWIRGAYRNQGIGRECLDDFLPRLMAQLSVPGPMPRLQVRLPEANRPGSPNTSQKGIWLSLFYKYGFRLDNNTRRNGQDLVLVREP